MISFLKKTEAFFLAHERVVMPAALLFGFIVDFLTLKRIDLFFENLVLFSYLVAAGVGIVLVNLYNGGRLRNVFFEHAVPWLRLLTQAAFGGLFSGYAVFYTRSAAFPENWLFIGLLFLLLVGNDFFKKQYERLAFQMSVFFVALFSFTIFFLPVVFKEIGVHLFLVGGVLSVLCVALLSLVLFVFVPDRLRKSRRALIGSIGGLYILLNVLYFTNNIPPIPLALKEIGVYHAVSRIAGDEYIVTKEYEEWYAIFKRHTEVHRVPGDSVYVFSAVFAPTRLSTPVFHRWYYFDRVRDEWILVDTFSFPIVGGRDGGYRGFSQKTNTISGRWRVDVVTGRGALLGRVPFSIVDAESSPVLIEVVR